MGMAKFYENKDKDIRCPQCNTFLLKADKDDPNVHMIACRYCKKWIWYIAKTDYYDVRNIPPRETSSGITFF